MRSAHDIADEILGWVGRGGGTPGGLRPVVAVILTDWAAEIRRTLAAPSPGTGAPLPWCAVAELPALCNHPSCAGPAPDPVKPPGEPCGSRANDGTACVLPPHPRDPNWHADGRDYVWNDGRTPAAEPGKPPDRGSRAVALLLQIREDASHCPFCMRVECAEDCELLAVLRPGATRTPAPEPERTGTVSYGPPVTSFPLAPPPAVTGGDFVAGVNGGPPTATPMTPAAEPGKPPSPETGGAAAPDVVQAREVALSLEANLVRANLTIGFQRGMREKAERLLEAATGDLAEKLALDMDHGNRDHSAWYRAVKAARAHLSQAVAAPGSVKPPATCEDARRVTRAALEMVKPAFEHLRDCTSPAAGAIALLRERRTTSFSGGNDPDDCIICNGDAEDCDVDGVCWGARVRVFLARIDAPVARTPAAGTAPKGEK